MRPGVHADLVAVGDRALRLEWPVLHARADVEHCWGEGVSAGIRAGCMGIESGDVGRNGEEGQVKSAWMEMS